MSQIISTKKALSSKLQILHFSKYYQRLRVAS